ncbi:MAG TPA: PKD domain-containing protein, partial [bacterium]
FDDSTDPDGLADIVKREWDFSFDVIDGFNPGSEEQNPQISYPSNGNYLVQLRVTDTENHQDLLDTPIQIVISGGGDNDPPIACGDASLYHVDIKIPPTTVSFSDCSFDPDGFTDMVLFEWDLDGDGTYEKFGQNTSKVYQTAGDYNVQHRVTDTVNNQDILDEPILIEVNAKPVASAEADQLNIQFGDFVTITNTSVDDDGNGPIDQVLWDVDGNGKYDDPDDIQGTDQIILSFFEAGVHQIGLKVVDEWGLADELDTKLEITVEGFPTFCVGLDDQYNSASSLYGTRSFKYFNDSINNLGGLTYKAANGPWDFNEVPASPPAICEWLLPSDPEVSQAKSLWPDADFFFKESAPGSGFQLVPHRFDFDPGPGPGPNGELVIQGQWEGTGVDFQYGDIFHITHEICHPWLDSGSGTSVFSGVEFDTTWTMTTLGTGPAIFTVNGETVILNCMLIRHNMSFVDTEFGFLTFSLLNYQWIDEDGNEVAFMQASNGLDGNNFSGSSYTGTVICRSLQSIS